MDVTQIILAVITTLLAPLIALIVWLAKSKHNQKKEAENKASIKKAEYTKELNEIKKRNEQLKELCNYVAGAVDIILEDAIEVRPEVRKPLQIFSKKYHSLDLTKLDKEDK